MNKKTKKMLDRETTDKGETESRREQVIWRLEKLLGDNCKENGMTREMQPSSDSICTEDFVRRFREEMVEMALSESNMQQLDTEEEVERIEISDSDTQVEQKAQSVHNCGRRKSAATGKSSKSTRSAHYSQLNKPHQTKELDKGLSVSYGVNISHEKAGTGESYKPLQRVDDNSSSKYNPYLP